MCLAGASRAGAELLAALPQAPLRAFYVWVPMLPPDDEAAAHRAAARFPEARARHYWDGDRLLASRLAQALDVSAAASIGLAAGHGIAWDVYLAYRPANGDLDGPDFWMHQLNLTHAPRLDTAAWRLQIERLLPP